MFAQGMNAGQIAELLRVGVPGITKGTRPQSKPAARRLAGAAGTSPAAFSWSP
jgi:hypothetical protein